LTIEEAEKGKVKGQERSTARSVTTAVEAATTVVVVAAATSALYSGVIGIATFPRRNAARIAERFRSYANPEIANVTWKPARSSARIGDSTVVGEG